MGSVPGDQGCFDSGVGSDTCASGPLACGLAVPCSLSAHVLRVMRLIFSAERGPGELGKYPMTVVELIWL